MTPQPYYQDGSVTIYHGDCLEILPLVPPARMAFADPPYNSGLAYGSGTDDSRVDYWAWLEERVSLMKRVGEVVLVKHSALKLSGFVERFGGRTLVWVKPFSSGYPLNGVATHWEPIHWLQGKSSQWSKDIFECSAGNTNREARTGHPAQFPEAVGAWLIQTFTSNGETVIDPFCGSGTMLRVAKDHGRKAIGIEIEERFCQMAAERLSQDVLFGDAA